MELGGAPPALPLEALAWRLAALLGGAGAGEAARLAGAARALARAAPALPPAVDARRRQLDQAVHGQYGCRRRARAELLARTPSSSKVPIGRVR